MEGIKSKLRFLVFVPMTFMFLGSTYLIYLSDSPVLLIANIVFFCVSMIFASLALGNVASKVVSDVKQMQTSIETVNYCSNLISMEINRSLEEQGNLQDNNLLRHDLEYISTQMKDLIVISLQQAEKTTEGRKELLLVAKQLGKLCTFTRQVAQGLPEGDSKSEKLLLITDNMMNHLTKLAKICGSTIEDKSDNVKELPLKSGTLRRVMKTQSNAA